MAIFGLVPIPKSQDISRWERDDNNEHVTHLIASSTRARKIVC